MIRELVESKLTELERVWEEVGHDLQMINFLVDKIRRNIEEALKTSENPAGCLHGQIDEFMEMF